VAIGLYPVSIVPGIYFLNEFVCEDFELSTYGLFLCGRLDVTE